MTIEDLEIRVSNLEILIKIVGIIIFVGVDFMWLLMALTTKNFYLFLMFLLYTFLLIILIWMFHKN